MTLLPTHLINVLFGCMSSKILLRSHSWHRVLNTTFSTERNIFGPVVPVFAYAKNFPKHHAFRDQHGNYTYQGLYKSSYQFAKQISDCLKDKTQERVAFLCHNDASYVIAQWACWMSGQIGK